MIYYWWEIKAKEFDDNIARIILYEDDLKDKKFAPLALRYDNTKDHKLVEVGYIFKKGSKEHEYFKNKLGLKLKNRLG